MKQYDLTEITSIAITPEHTILNNNDMVVFNNDQNHTHTAHPNPSVLSTLSMHASITPASNYSNTKTKAILPSTAATATTQIMNK